MIFKDKVGNDLKYKHIYLTYVDNFIGAYNPYTNEVVGYKTRDRFVEFVTEIMQKYPDFSLHNIINQGVEEEIRKHIIKDYRCKEQSKQR